MKYLCRKEKLCRFCWEGRFLISRFNPEVLPALWRQKLSLNSFTIDMFLLLFRHSGNALRSDVVYLAKSVTSTPSLLDCHLQKWKKCKVSELIKQCLHSCSIYYIAWSWFYYSVSFMISSLDLISDFIIALNLRICALDLM